MFQDKTYWIPCCGDNLSQESIDVGTDKYSSVSSRSLGRFFFCGGEGGAGDNEHSED